MLTIPVHIAVHNEPFFKLPNFLPIIQFCTVTAIEGWGFNFVGCVYLYLLRMIFSVL